jgi:lysine 2,3-aminomutase
MTNHGPLPDLRRNAGKRWHDWRWQLRHAFDAAGLSRAGLLHGRTAAAARRFPARITPYYASLIDWRDPADPIRRQCLPDAAELIERSATDSADPFGERCRPPAPGVVHRFPDRVLVLVSRDCATACRHCTRRNLLPRLRPLQSPRDLSRTAAYVAAHPAVREVILSGGDPFLLPDAWLGRIVETFAALPGIDAVRVGTRVPAVLPMRVTAALACRLGATRRVWVNTQFNHPREITPEAAAACGRLVDAGIPVSNQSVLLRGVNDRADVLTALCAGLQRMRVRPYYLFVCDRVAGTGHFRTSLRVAQRLGRVLARRLGGLAVPRVVTDRPGAPFKRPV